MENDGILSLCKYYKGEEECPFHMKSKQATYWSMEQTWVKLVHFDELRSDQLLFAFAMAFPDCLDNIPVVYTLKATMWEQYSRFGGDKRGFIDFLLGYYLDETD